MKYIILFLMIFYGSNNAFSQETEGLNEFPISTYHRIIDEESTDIIIYERLDGSVFEKYIGEMNFVELIPSDNRDFADMTADIPSKPRNQMVYTRFNGETFMTYDMNV